MSNEITYFNLCDHDIHFKYGIIHPYKPNLISNLRGTSYFKQCQKILSFIGKEKKNIKYIVSYPICKTMLYRFGRRDFITSVHMPGGWKVRHKLNKDKSLKEFENNNFNGACTVIYSSNNRL